MAAKMGFEGLLYYGVAGSTASTLLENCKDITLSMDTEVGDTTVRGDSTSPPTNTEAITANIVGIEFVMLNDSSDTALEAIKAAWGNTTVIALRGKDHSSGKGPDMDVNVKTISTPWPLKGEQVVTITTTPNRANRDPVKYT